MVKIVQRVGTKKALDDLIYPSSRNATVTFSSIGEPCLRKLWYGFHWVSQGQTTSKQHRTFGVGNLFEKICIKQLRAIGITVFKLDEQGVQVDITGDEGPEFKQEVLRGKTGHEKGKPDGRCIGVHEAPKTEHLLELKTAKNKSWKEMKARGVQMADPGYYAQVHRLMLAMKLERCLFISINKDTSEYHVERIYFDKDFAKMQERKEIMIVTSQEPPERAWPEGHYKCDMCSRKMVCDKVDEPDKNCRTCAHVEIEQDGKWICSHKKQKEKDRSYNLQIAGCEHYEKGFGL